MIHVVVMLSSKNHENINKGTIHSAVSEVTGRDYKGCRIDEIACKLALEHWVLRRCYVEASA